MILKRILPNGNDVSIGKASIQNSNEISLGYTFKVVLNGKQLYKWYDKEIILYPDSFLVFEPKTVYSSEMVSFTTQTQILSICLSTDFIHHLRDNSTSSIEMPSQGIFPFKGDMRFNIKNFIRSLSSKDCEDALINHYLEHVLINCNSLYQQEFVSKQEKLSFAKANTKKEIFERLKLAKEYILHNYNKKISIDELAAYSCLSVNHLLRTFKQAYGLSPYQYLTLVRLNRAKIYLESNNHSINETVIMVGFESASAFIRLFKATFNTTPLKFRKQFLSKK